MKRIRPYVAKKYRCKCAGKRPAVHYPDHRFTIVRIGPDQFMVADAKTHDGVKCHHWPKCLGEEIIERYRGGELKRREWTILNGQVHIYPKAA